MAEQEDLVVYLEAVAEVVVGEESLDWRVFSEELVAAEEEMDLRVLQVPLEDLPAEAVELLISVVYLPLPNLEVVVGDSVVSQEL